MSEWREALFSELCDITRGASPRPIHDFLDKEGMPWIKIADATSLNSRFIEKTNECIKLHGVKASVRVFPGDLILSNSATPGLPKFVSIEACIHDGWMLLRNFRGLDKHYAYWLLLNERKNLVAQGNGSVFTNLKTDILKSHRVKIPDHGTQKAIADILDEISTKIELNRQINETLEAIARLFFKDWFVDFGPTRAKAEGRPPYLTPELWALFPNILDDDDKPLRWRIGELQEIVVLNPNEPLPREQVAPYLEMASLPTSGPISEPPVERSFSSGMRFRNEDTLFARITPCLENGKAAFVQNLPPHTIGWGSTEFIVMRSRSPIPKPYSYILARDPAFRANAIRSMTGTSGRQRARTEAIAQYPITIPTEAVWYAFGSIVDPLFEQIRANGEETQTLVELRDLLLPKLMSGEIRLREAEKLVEQAL